MIVPGFGGGIAAACAPRPISSNSRWRVVDRTLTGSVPAAEYEEKVNKARGVLAAVEMARRSTPPRTDAPPENQPQNRRHP